LAPAASAQSSVRLEEVLSGLRDPVFVTHAGDGSGRLFVIERAGRIRVQANGELQTFLDITSLVNSGGSEQGLLGLAFHPQFRSNGIFFVAYTARRNGNADTLARYRLSPDPNRADPGSATILIEQPDRAPNHNGGMLAFGPDGFLYLGTGDEGAANDSFRNAQDLSSLFGKMLRLDVDRMEGAHCRSGGCDQGGLALPVAVLGFAQLKAQLGEPMGNPLENEHGNPDNCDTQQQTSTGLAYWRCSTGLVTFAAAPDGLHHWALVDGRLVEWTGPSPSRRPSLVRPGAPEAGRLPRVRAPTGAASR
jgi:hypothetical protein